MSRSTMLIVLGALMAIVPFTGFPGFWKTVFFIFAAVIVIGIGVSFRIYKEVQEAHGPPPAVDTFSESNGAHVKES